MLYFGWYGDLLYSANYFYECTVYTFSYKPVLSAVKKITTLYKKNQIRRIHFIYVHITSFSFILIPTKMLI